MTAYNCQLENLETTTSKKYDLIYADPAWFYNDQKKVRKDVLVPTKGIGACHHYSLMKTEAMEKLPIASIAKERSLCFMWATAPLLPEAFKLMSAWGFTKYCTVAFVWVKLNPKQTENYVPSFLPLCEGLDKLTFFGPGYYTASNTEYLLLSRKGNKSFRHVKGAHFSQVVYAPRESHSKKPDIFRDKISLMYPDLEKAELFARTCTDGWDCYGNEL